MSYIISKQEVCQIASIVQLKDRVEVCWTNNQGKMYRSYLYGTDGYNQFNSGDVYKGEVEDSQFKPKKRLA